MTAYVAGNVQPYEAKTAVWVEITGTMTAATQDVLTAVNGFPYHGDRGDAVMQTIGWLRTRPDVCAALGLTDVTPASTDPAPPAPLTWETM